MEEAIYNYTYIEAIMHEIIVIAVIQAAYQSIAQRWMVQLALIFAEMRQFAMHEGLWMAGGLKLVLYC